MIYKLIKKCIQNRIEDFEEREEEDDSEDEEKYAMLRADIEDRQEGGYEERNHDRNSKDLEVYKYNIQIQYTNTIYNIQIQSTFVYFVLFCFVLFCFLLIHSPGFVNFIVTFILLHGIDKVYNTSKIEIKIKIKTVFFT